MLQAPEGIEPLKIISKIEEITNEQLVAPEDVEPIRIIKKNSKQPEKVDSKEKSTPKTENCVGWNKFGCKSESIKKVQTCLNIPVSGTFDENLKLELSKYSSTYAFKDGFNDSDVERICRYKSEEDKKLMLQQNKQSEQEKFRRQYPQQTTKATTIDQF
jgi:hypothetical protein